MRQWREMRWVLALIASVIVLTACGAGEGGIEGSGFSEVNLKGTAAIGAPIANSNVVIKDKNGKKHTTTTDDNGKYETTLIDMEAPFLLKIDQPQKPSLFSIAMEGGISNIHPLSDFVMRNWYGVEGRDIAVEFESDDAIANPPTKEKIVAIQQKIESLMATSYSQFQVTEGFDFFNSEFDANSTGFDMLLDFTVVIIEVTNITINLIDPVTLIQGTIVDGFDLSTDITEPDTQSPTLPLNLLALPSGATGVVTVWNPSTDNIGIAGYNIYRDGTIITSIPYPVFSDSRLTAATNYCYSIEAFDGAGNVSSKTSDVCTTTLIENDTTAPATVTNFKAKINENNAVELTWTPSVDEDVLGYHVHRSFGESFTKIATVVSTSYTDENMDASTDYCYEVQAFDASGNLGIVNAQACTTTTEDPVVVETDTFPPTTTASPSGGEYNLAQNVTLTCTDNGGSGCKNTYYTTDGSEPDSNSTLYTSAINIGETTSLKYFSIDNADNKEATKTEEYTITLPPPQTTYTLSINTNDNSGTITSDLAGIDCGITCSADYPANTSIVLSASHPSDAEVQWIGCNTVVSNTCNVQMGTDRQVNVTFVSTVSESEPNDSFNTANLVAATINVEGFFDSGDDADYYEFEITETGTFYAHISHPDVASYLYLYDSTLQQLARTGGSADKLHTLNYSLTPGTYYIIVTSYSTQYDLNSAYNLVFSDTVLGSTSLDTHEENDYFNTVTIVSSASTQQGYFDTRNDWDYYTFEVTAAGTFSTTVSHASVASYLYLEEVLMNYADSNSGIVNPAISIAISVRINGQSLRSYVNNAEAFGKLTVSYGNTISAMINTKVDYSYFRPSSSVSFTISPAIDVAILNQDMGVVLVFPGQINTADGDSNSAEKISMTMLGAVLGRSTSVTFETNIFSLFKNSTLKGGSKNLSIQAQQKAV